MIEQNSFSIDQVSDILEGKRVLGSPQDIREAKNAYEVYVLRTIFGKRILKMHKVMMRDLVKKSGTFRSKDEGVHAGTELIYAGTTLQ